MSSQYRFSQRPLRETILAAHKSANDFLASQVPSVKEILSTNKEREFWGQLIEKDPTMRHRLSELRFNVFKNILQSLGLSFAECF